MDQIYVCKICSYKINRSDSLRKHAVTNKHKTKIVNNPQCFNCNYCDFETSDIDKYINHCKSCRKVSKSDYAINEKYKKLEKKISRLEIENKNLKQVNDNLNKKNDKLVDAYTKHPLTVNYIKQDINVVNYCENNKSTECYFSKFDCDIFDPKYRKKKNYINLVDEKKVTIPKKIYFDVWSLIPKKIYTIEKSSKTRPEISFKDEVFSKINSASPDNLIKGYFNAEKILVKNANLTLDEKKYIKLIIDDFVNIISGHENYQNNTVFTLLGSDAKKKILKYKGDGDEISENENEVNENDNEVNNDENDNIFPDFKIKVEIDELPVWIDDLNSEIVKEKIVNTFKGWICSKGYKIFKKRLLCLFDDKEYYNNYVHVFNANLKWTIMNLTVDVFNTDEMDSYILKKLEKTFSRKF